MRTVPLVALLGGCAQVFGLDPTTADPRPKVSLEMERMSVGATIVRRPLDVTGHTATYLVPDDADPTGLARVVADQVDVDTWSANIRDATPPIEFDLPDFPVPITRQLDLPNATVKSLFAVLEHPDPTPADPNAMFTVNVALDSPYVAGQGLQMFTLGSWNVRGLEAPAAGATVVTPPPFAMSSMQSLTGRPYEQIRTDDAVVVLRYNGNDLISALDVVPFAQTGNDQISGAMTAVAHDQTLDATIDPQTAVMRFSAARPTVANPQFAWALRAAPGYAIAQDLGPLINAANPLPTDTKITVPFGNPFVARDWRTVFTWATSESRTFTPPGQPLAVTLIAQMFERHLVDGPLQLTLPAGLPELVQLDGVPLSTDGLKVAPPTKAVVVTVVANPTTNTLFQLQLLDIVPNAANTALEVHNVYAMTAVQPRFTIPPEVFQVGHTYTLRAVTISGGHPAIADGDFTTRELPFALALLDSGVFQVMP